METKKIISRVFLTISLAMFLAFNLIVTNHVNILINIFLDNRCASDADLLNLLSDSWIPYTIVYLFLSLLKYLTFIFSLGSLITHVCLELKIKKGYKTLISISIIFIILIFVFINRVVVNILDIKNIKDLLGHKNGTIIYLILSCLYLLLSCFELTLINIVSLILVITISIVTIVKSRGRKKLFSIVFPITYLVITIPAFIINFLISIFNIVIFILMIDKYGSAILIYMPF